MVNIADVDKQGYDSLSTSEKEDLRQQVRDESSTGFDQMNDDKLDWAIKKALGERDSIYSDRMARSPTLDGDPEIFSVSLAAHHATLAEGGEAQSESNQGGNVSYNTVTGDAVDALSQTRYGRTALEHVRDRQGIGMARSFSTR